MRPSEIVPTNLMMEIGQIAILEASAIVGWFREAAEYSEEHSEGVS